MNYVEGSMVNNFEVLEIWSVEFVQLLCCVNVKFHSWLSFPEVTNINILLCTTATVECCSVIWTLNIYFIIIANVTKLLPHVRFGISQKSNSYDNDISLKYDFKGLGASCFLQMPTVIIWWSTECETDLQADFCFKQRV